MNTRHIERVEADFANKIKALNFLMRTEGYDSPPQLSMVMAQAQQEMTWFLEHCQAELNERDYILFYQVAFYKAIEAMYPSVFISEDFKANLVNNDYERMFDAVSPASQARQKLDRECQGLLVALEVIRDQAERVSSRSTDMSDQATKDKEAFMGVYTEVLADAQFYHQRQSLAIRETGKLDDTIRAYTHTQCLASIARTAGTVAKSSTWMDLFKGMAVAVKAWFGVASVVEKTAGSYAFYQPQDSSTKLAHAKNIINQTINSAPVIA